MLFPASTSKVPELQATRYLACLLEDSCQAVSTMTVRMCRLYHLDLALSTFWRVLLPEYPVFPAVLV